MTQQQQRPFTEIPLPQKKHRVILMAQQIEIGEKADYACMYPIIGTTGKHVMNCTAYTETDCGVCGRPTCPEHLSKQRFYVNNEGAGCWYDCLCLSCEKLLREDQQTIREVRLKINR